MSVDGKPLSESKRIVVAYSTNALNTGMEFVDDSMRGLISMGKPPVLCKTGKFSFRLKNKNAHAFKLYALGMNGARVQELNSRAGRGMHTRVDRHVKTQKRAVGRSSSSRRSKIRPRARALRHSQNEYLRVAAQNMCTGCS